MNFIFVLVLLVNFIVSRCEGCSTAEIEAGMKLLYSHFVNAACQDGNLQAGFIRAGFHDCITTVPGMPATGCNGSLRNEADFRANARLGPIIEFITSARDSLAPCVSYADSFLLAYAGGVKCGTGISIVAHLVDPRNPRKDVDIGITDADSNGASSLPSPFDGHEKLVAFYGARNMSMYDLAVSNAVGHSFGSARVFGQGPPFLLKNFTAIPTRVGPLYAAHLLWRSKNNAVEDLKGFFTLRSDQALTTTSEGVAILERYARYKLTGSGNPDKKNGKGGHQKLQFYWTGFEEHQLLLDFQLFSVKMSQLTGDMMTNSADFNIPSEAYTLRKMASGWDGPQNDVFISRGSSVELNPELKGDADNAKSWFHVSSEDKIMFFKAP